MSFEPVDWHTIHSRPLISVPDCWKGCGGFCCSNSHPDFRFRLLPNGGQGTIVVYLDDEYAWLKANGHRICGEDEGKEIQPMIFDFGGPRPIMLRHVPCRHLGRCNELFTKPLLCRTYPFVPVIGVDGAIEEVVPAAILDATFELKEGLSLCPLNDAPGPTLIREALAGDDALAQALRHPLIVLHTQGIKAFWDSYREKLLAWDGFGNLSGQAFWQAWELAYLGRRLVDRDKVAAHLRHVHGALVARHGDYLG
ncbi:MAG: hypothetical protein H7841_03980 [Magnetospirillum sp. WYHS-4]